MNNPTDAASLVRAHLWIQGRVQGVGYRASTHRKARQLHLNGWVRNLRDGRVEVVLEGPEPQVKDMIHWCRSGPPAAAVREMKVEYEIPEGLQEFQVAH